MWDKKFKVLYKIVLKEKTLELDVNVANTGEEEFDLTFCFHTYFTASDVPSFEVTNLKGLTYTDKTAGGAQVEEKCDVVKIKGFTDRVYADAPDEIKINNAASGKTLKLTKSGLNDWVVWNPWETAAKMADMHDSANLEFVCVEATQASKSIYVASGGQWQAKHSITIE